MKLSSFLSLATLCLCLTTARAQYASKLQTLPLKPHPSIDTVEFNRQYKGARAWWDKVFGWMRTADAASLQPGSYPIDGDNVFVRVSQSPRDFDSSRWEGHRYYHDIHFIISGKERIGKGVIARDTAITAYDSSRDITFYRGPGDYYPLDPGEFFIFFTGDAHRPFIKESGYPAVKHIVIKIRAIP
ncbi:MAG TPA: YhcH/YjgK/YiaL family protein [Puia sp.]